MIKRFISKIDVKLIDKMGSDLRIAQAAWVSTAEEVGELHETVKSEDDVKGVINYLVANRHGSPFEHGALQFCVHATIFVWREWHRHRIASYNEESARYKTLKPVFYIPLSNRPMFKVEGWKAGKPKFRCAETPQDFEFHKRLCHNLIEVYNLGYDKYIENLNMSFDPGLARACLPVGTYSSCWVTLNPRSLMNFLSLRTYNPEAVFVSYPLYEIEAAARACEDIFKKHWPVTYAAFVKNGYVAP